MIDPLSAIGLIAIGACLAYAVPFGILMWKTRGSTVRLEGLRFVDRIDPQWVSRVDGVPVEMRPKQPDYYDMAKDRSGDE